MGRPALDAKKVFFDHFKKLPGGCWKWTREIHSTTGYGRFKANHVEWNAHRFSYKYFKGSIPDRFHVHHICENRWCVNPKHLEAISPSDHVLIGKTITGENIRKQFCIHGHKFTKENTYTYRRKKERTLRRMCIICRNASSSRAYRKKHQSLPTI